jgi:hypothetical protein
VPRHGSRADYQFRRDGLIAAAACDQRGDLEFPRGQRAGRRGGGGDRRDLRRRGRLAERQLDSGLGGHGEAARPQARDGLLAEAAGGCDVPLGPGARQRRQAAGLAQRGRRRGEQDGPFGLSLSDGERGEGL